jgi:hypothetical protein
MGPNTISALSRIAQFMNNSQRINELGHRGIKCGLYRPESTTPLQRNMIARRRRPHVAGSLNPGNSKLPLNGAKVQW